MAHRVVLVGGGGHGRELLDLIDALNKRRRCLTLVGVVDERGDPEGLLARRGLSVLGGNDILPTVEADGYVLGLGDPVSRQAVAHTADAAGLAALTLVHPSAVLGSDLRLGAGFVAAAHAVVTTNVEAGRHVHLNVAATVSHDCVLGDYVTLSPGCHVSGNVRLGSGVTLGAGAVIRQGVSIGPNTVVGAGAVVIADLPAGVTAVGVPARPVQL